MTPTQKNLLLDHLTVSYNHICTLKIICQEKGLSDEANKLDPHKAFLKERTEGLLHDLYHSWTGNAKALQDTTEDQNKRLGKCIADIQKNIDTAGNIIKAIGYIDDVVKAAADLVA
jgi:hypothetical protein